MKVEHRGLEQFKKGTFAGGGDNLFIDANGVMRRIFDNDLNGDGTFDIVLPNSHGYIERAPTYIYSHKEGNWEKTELPHDSCWMPGVADIDGDGYLDLIIANAENGVSSQLKSYIYWGGPDGLTGERTIFNTIGAYDAAFWDLSGNGLKDIIFTTAWYDHHNAGVPMYQKVFVQTSPRQFTDATEKYKIPGLATLSLICEDLNNDGYPEIVLANFREGYNYDTDSLIYNGSIKGFDISIPVRLPTHYASQVLAADLNGDGFKELIFTGGDKVMIYWNDNGEFRPENRLDIDIIGMRGQFMFGSLPVDAADVDGDGIVELLIGANKGVEIRKADNLMSVWRQLPCYGITGIKAADIRNTGRMDIITSYYCSTKSYDTKSMVFWNSENGYSIENVTAFETHGPMGCTAADLDNDGIKEIIFCNTMKGPSQMDPEFPVFAYYGTPEYMYLTENRRDYPVNMMCHTYIPADIDNDGYVELIVTIVNGIRIFKGTREGPDPGIYYDITHTPGSITGVGGILAGDFNHDGWLDLIMIPFMSGNREEDLENSVFVYWGGHEGYSYDRRTLIPVFAGGVQLADINNDGYVDFLFTDCNEGSIGIYYGDKEGFSRERTGKIYLKDYNGALFGSITAGDIDKDGWLELVVTTAGHYTRLPSHVYVMLDGKNNFPADKQIMFETGGTTGEPSLADIYRSGNLDLILPFYSTHETRELPARIFRGDGKGNFDWENPHRIDCLASIAFCPVDLNGNGYPDLFICCHRDDLGHSVNSKLIMNGPDGLDIENSQNIPGYGPHGFTNKDQGNSRDRSDKEYYTSPVFECIKPLRLEWEGETPHKTSLSFRVRFGIDKEDTLESQWSDSITRNGSTLNAPAGTRYMQYEVAFQAPGFVNSPRLTAVVIKCEV